MKTVFFGPNGSVVKWAYTDVIESKEIEYCEYPDFKEITQKLFLSSTAEKVFPACLRRKIYTRLLKYQFLKHFDKDEEHFFVFTCQNNMFFTPFFFVFVRFLKKAFKKSKFLFYYYDLIKTCMPENLEFVKKEFDLVYTFDKGDAENYGITFYGEICVKNHSQEKDEENYDFLYIGTDRGRMNAILSVFDKLTFLEKKCNFFVFRVLDENVQMIKDKYGDKVQMIDENKGKISISGSALTFNVYVPYVETLKHINSTRGMVEIVFEGQTAGTMRLPESVIYKKKLVSNCQSIRGRDVYNENNILLFNGADDLTKENIDKLLACEFVEVDHDFSATKMIEKAKEILFN